MRSWLVALVLSIASGATGVAPSPPAEPAAAAATSEVRPKGVLEALRYNGRERTAKAMAELERENFIAAAESLETAQRLAPESPTTLYNLGTGHLHALDSRAIAELERALEGSPPALLADTAYNLGNARFAADDFQGAVDAYKSTLRADASHGDAKYNLELALEKLEEQQQQQQQQSDSPSDSDSEGEDGDSGDQDSPPGEEPNDGEDSSAGDRESDEQGGDPDAEESDGEDRRNPLPQFEEQPEMTAEQAAAILEAVDNLERQQRQEDARDQARPVPVGGKDW